MKNILVLHNTLDYNKSGVERVSFLLKEELTSCGHICFEGCTTGGNPNNQDNVFEYHFNDPQTKVLNDLFNFINKNRINIIIVQGLFDPNINNALAHLKASSLCKIVFCLHNSPSAYVRKTPLPLWSRAKILIWYFLKFKETVFDYSKHRLKMLAEMYSIADRFVLLSNTYTDDLHIILKIQNLDKVSSINNPLSFKRPKTNNHQKKKQVLILGRLEDFQKNISSALRIWKAVEDYGVDDWNLVIAGSGVDEKKLIDYAKSLNLKHCTFVGETSEPEKYYQESAIFMMTSNVEGWPMTLLEAQQCGCVPVVYNTFSALSEIITSNENGFIIPSNYETTFAKKIIELMDNESLRQKISQKAMEDCQKFSPNKFGDKWNALLEKL